MYTVLINNLFIMLCVMGMLIGVNAYMNFGRLSDAVCFLPINGLAANIIIGLREH